MFIVYDPMMTGREHLWAEEQSSIDQQTWTKRNKWKTFVGVARDTLTTTRKQQVRVCTVHV